MIEFKGKLLLRRSKTESGKPVLIICGVVEPNVPVEKFDDRDEMWAVHLLALDHVEFLNTSQHQFSPEDFLENVDDIQNKTKWTPFASGTRFDDKGDVVHERPANRPEPLEENEERKMQITDDDRKKYPHHTDDSIIGIKIVKALTNEQLKGLKAAHFWEREGAEFDTLLKQVGDGTNPNWLATRIADELYDRHLIDETEYDYFTHDTI